MAANFYKTARTVEITIIVVLAVIILFWVIHPKRQRDAEVSEPSSPGRTTKTVIGLASYYGNEFHGQPTASGEPYDQNDLTAAHRTLAFGTRVRVTNLENGKSVIVRINDRGPHQQGRIIDLSARAAKTIGLLEKGIVKVQLEVLK